MFRPPCAAGGAAGASAPLEPIPARMTNRSPRTIRPRCSCPRRSPFQSYELSGRAVLLSSCSTPCLKLRPESSSASRAAAVDNARVSAHSGATRDQRHDIRAVEPDRVVCDSKVGELSALAQRVGRSFGQAHVFGDLLAGPNLPRIVVCHTNIERPPRARRPDIWETFRMAGPQKRGVFRPSVGHRQSGG
jgi:hypothetical protein